MFQLRSVSVITLRYSTQSEPDVGAAVVAEPPEVKKEEREEQDEEEDEGKVSGLSCQHP